MAFEYFDALNLNDEERALFRSSGAVNAETVLGQMYGAPADFQRLLGSARFSELQSQLQNITGGVPDVTESLPVFAMGSMLSDAPEMRPANEELLQRRDRVYARIRELEGQGGFSGNGQAELSSLRTELQTIFEELDQ